ncbi:endonuclease 8-like 1 isoform X2 [Micropterus salmoides]|uniref:endonuclease 8-like 1 isoform X2 n=1 Tax=Micropterus salmoides TaxID=27706 RepID=UPI0018EA7FC7|nr:endonuclease 8-like 1 isoform X2 [Micropterus salmoides]
MPEGPELHLASLYVNKMCNGVVFTGPVRKSEVSKSPDVPFNCESYWIAAASRGKEVKLTLTPLKSDDPKQRVKAEQADQPMDIVFRFGMSGYFCFTTEDELPKHAHLCFYSKEKPCRVLSFVDVRRFGSWQSNGTWQPNRGPCVMFEYKSFRENVVSHLSDHAFDRPICEVLLNQKYFNGIGNYLRAEILYSAFLSCGYKTSDRARQKMVKGQNGDLLRLCHTVPLEVLTLGGKGYDPVKADYSGFEAWLQCYNVDGMKSIRDHNGRTIWFNGEPGPMAPKDSKSPKAKKWKKKEDDHDYTDKKKVARSRSASTKKKVVKQETVNKTPKKEQDMRLKEVGSKRIKTENTRGVNTPLHEKGVSHSIARRRKSSSAEPTVAGPLRRSARLTKQNNM